LLAFPAVALAQQPAPASQPSIAERVSALITPGTGLTADEASRRARSTSYEIRAGQEDVAANEAITDEARAGWWPHLVGTARYARLSGIGTQSLGSGNLVATTLPQGPIPMGTPLFSVELVLPVLLNFYSLQGSLTVPLSDYFLRVPQSVAAAARGTDASSANLEATRNNVDASARTTYYAWVRARLQVEVALAAVDNARGHLADVQKAFNVGSASRADVLRVESSLSTAQLSLVRAQNGAELAEVRLRTVMHDSGEAPLGIGENVLADMPADDEDPKALTQRALTNRPELRALANNIAATREHESVQRAGYWPRLDLVGNVQDANPNPRIFPQQDDFRATWDVNAVLTWTPTDIPLVRGQVHESEARAAQLEAQRDLTADNVRIEVWSDWQAVKEARQAITTTTSALGTAEEAYRVRRALFQNGRATSLELTDSELDLTRARLEAIDARIDLRVAKANLAKAVAGK
jgi:outer membrane protein TolC